MNVHNFVKARWRQQRVCLIVKNEKYSIAMKTKRTAKAPGGPSKMPVWALVLIVGSVLPVIGWPWYMSRFDFGKPEQTTFLAVVFPIYAVLCGYLAYKCYPFRKEVTYILLSILWLSYAAALFL